jgi:glutaredoxin
VGGRNPTDLACWLDRSMKDVVLYKRQGCHLCDDALDLLHRYGVDVSCVDIDNDPDLCARFDTCVPVVEIAGRIRFRGRINEVLLRRLLGGTERLSD